MTFKVLSNPNLMILNESKPSTMYLQGSSTRVLPLSFLQYCNQATELSGYLTSDIKSSFCYIYYKLMSFPPAESFFIIHFLRARMSLTGFPPEGNRDCKIFYTLMPEAFKHYLFFTLKKQMETCKVSHQFPYRHKQPILLSMFLS